MPIARSEVWRLMANITRALMKIFGDAAATGQFAQWGSLAAGAPIFTKDAETIQNLTQYDNGLFPVIASGAEPPRAEDFNALFYLFAYQLSYLFQKGIPQWDDATEYYADISYCQVGGEIYQAIQGTGSPSDNLNKNPTTNPLWWRLIAGLPTVAAWNVATDYTAAGVGTLVERFGRHYSSTGIAGNTGKDPVDPANVIYWFPSPGVEKLEQMAKQGVIFRGGLHSVNDFASSQYAQNLLIDKMTRGGQDYEFYMVKLDGTQVTGDATLEAIFDVGGGNEYPYLSLVAPGAPKILLEGREKFLRAMGAGGGNAPTLAAIQQDEFQGHDHPTKDNGATSVTTYIGNGAARQLLADQFNAAGTYTATFGSGDRIFGPPVADGIPNGTPRVGSETRPSNIVEGVYNIIVMKVV